MISFLTTSQQAAIFLLICIILDFVTGILASWIEYMNDPLLLIAKKKYVIESKKLRLTAVKFSSYAIGILGAWCIETIFFTKRITLEYITTKDLTLTAFVIGFFCMVELYSIFFENIRRMGFDIIQKTKNIISEVSKLYKTIINGHTYN